MKNKTDSTINKIERLYKELLKAKVIYEVLDLTGNFFDEPKFYYYKAVENLDYKFYNRMAFSCSGEGVSAFNRELALLKCLAETGEQISSYFFSYKQIIIDTYDNLKKQALNLNIFSQHVKLNNTIINTSFNKHKLGWIKSYNLSKKTYTYIPAQLIYPNYQSYALYEKDITEPYLIGGDRTGYAGDFDSKTALLRGIYEVIERDAMTNMFLCQYIPPLLNIEKINDNNIQNTVSTLKKYQLLPFIFDIRNDLSIPVFMALIIDLSGAGPVLSMGFAARLETNQGILIALQEAFMSRITFRSKVFNKFQGISFQQMNNIRINQNKLNGLYWSGSQTLKQMSYLLKNWPKKQRNISARNLKTKLPINELSYISKLIDKKGYQVYYKETTLDYLRKTGFRVYKVLIPGLEPQLQLGEPLKVFLKRQKKVKKFYKTYAKN